jgi:hypothetical protein
MMFMLDLQLQQEKSPKQLAQVTSVVKTFAHKIVTALIVKKTVVLALKGQEQIVKRHIRRTQK